jgi:hypothetical protein
MKVNCRMLVILENGICQISFPKPKADAASGQRSIPAVGIDEDAHTWVFHYANDNRRYLRGISQPKKIGEARSMYEPVLQPRRCLRLRGICLTR